MCSETIHIAGRYNKYLRNLSQSPWIDKDDVRIKHSVQELIEDGLKEFLKFDKSIFSSSGREDVDVRMLGKGRPFVFKLTNPWDSSNYNQETMTKIQDYVNTRHRGKISIRDFQVVSKESVAKNLMDGQESKMKQYRALCCCSRPLSPEDIERINKTEDLYINQNTPIRVLHRRTLAIRRRKVQRMSIERVQVGEFDSVKPENLDRLFALNLVTEAGTYIKEFVHGDFGRTEPCLYSILGDCDTDLMELDVMVSQFAHGRIEQLINVYCCSLLIPCTRHNTNYYSFSLSRYRRFILTGRQLSAIRIRTQRVAQ